MDNKLFNMVKRRFCDSLEVKKYRRRVRKGLLTWEKAVALKYLSPPGSLLDIGCGAGREALVLYDMGHTVVGVDISPGMIEAAKSIAHEEGKDITFCLCDGIGLDFPDSSFQYVVIWGQALGNIPGHSNRLHLLSECLRVLKLSGKLIFSVHNRDVCEPIAYEKGWVRKAKGMLLDDGDFIIEGDAPSASDTLCFWHYFRYDEVVRLCEEAGFLLLECKLASDFGQKGWDTIWVCVCEK